MRQTKFLAFTALGCLIAFGAFSPASAQQDTAGADVFIAGVVPSERPAGAPVITQMTKDSAWYQYALTGVTPPYPASLQFLEDQGAWFNPFLHPGATGPYDIRNWHTAD